MLYSDMQEFYFLASNTNQVGDFVKLLGPIFAVVIYRHDFAKNNFVLVGEL